jgi:hypothetical protein
MHLSPVVWPTTMPLQSSNSSGGIIIDGTTIGKADVRPLGRSATIQDFVSPALVVNIGGVEISLLSPEFVSERGKLRWVGGLLAFEEPQLRAGWWFLSRDCAAAFGVFPLLVSEELWGRIAPLIADLEINSNTGLPNPPFNRRRDLGAFATAIEARRSFPELNETERHEAVRIIRQLVDAVKPGRAGRRSQSTGNPAAHILAPLDLVLDEIVQQAAPLIGPRARGQGVWGKTKARSEFHRMVRDAEPAPGTPPEVVALRRRLIGTDEQRDSAVASQKRNSRRKRAQP